MFLLQPYCWAFSPCPARGHSRPPPQLAACPWPSRPPRLSAAAETAQIKAFLTGEVGKLCAVNNNGLSAAREAIINEAKGGSPQFLVKYAEILNAEAFPIIQKCNDMRGRLNAGIAVAKVAELANNSKLEKCVLALLDKDQPEALKVWGIRAAQIGPAGSGKSRR